jgi:hypothetical protein
MSNQRQADAEHYRAVAPTVSHWLVSPTAHSATLHIPDPDAEADRPLCRISTGRSAETPDEWLRKDTSVYPPGHHPVCAWCRDRQQR